MENNSNNIPTHEEVRNIFNETYNAFYKKWINPNTQYNPELMLQEARELDRKYNHQKIVSITELIVCIENERRRDWSE